MAAARGRVVGLLSCSHSTALLWKWWSTDRGIVRHSIQGPAPNWQPHRKGPCTPTCRRRRRVMVPISRFSMIGEESSMLTLMAVTLSSHYEPGRRRSR
jgi:hypothetical protein